MDGNGWMTLDAAKLGAQIHTRRRRPVERSQASREGIEASSRFDQLRRPR